MRASLPKKDKLIPISEAALVLDVSIDTVRRWDRKGILHSKRINGKNRYFSIDELEKVKFAKPLSISEASKYLGISPTTLRRLEVRGLIKPDRNEAGERVYNKESLEKFLNGEYFLRQKKIEEKILRPEEPEKEPPTHKVLAVLQQETGQEVSKLLNFRKAFYVGGALLLTTFILLVTFITVSFLLYPAKTAQFFGYRQNSNVLGVSYLAKEIQEKDQVLGQALKPLADFSLGVVSQIDKKTYEQIIPKKAILDVNDVLSVNEKGNLSVKYNFEFPDSSYLQMSDSGLVKNLNVEYVQGKVPGSGNGDLVVWGKDSTIEGLTIQAYDTIQEEGSSLTQRTTLNFAGAGFTATDDSSNLRTNVSMNSGLNNIAGLSLTDGNFIVGNGVNWVAESGSTARGSLGLGSIATQDASSVTITGGTLAGITDLAVADGGTGSSTGSITGSSALTFTAGGTNQNVTLTPSGSGYTILNGNVGIGTASPAYLLQVSGNVGIGGVFLASNGSASAPSYSFTNLTNAGLWTNGDGLLLTTGGSNTSGITVTGAGNVGIGTTSPAGLFQVGSGATSSFVVTSAGNIGIGTTGPLGTLSVLSANTTGVTTSSALNLSANSLTTGTGLYAASSTLTSGLLMDLQVSGTAAAASQTALNILTTGANATNAITTYGAQISNTHTNATSGTNVALYLNASGATTANYGLIVNAGNVGIGLTTANSQLSISNNVHIGSLFQGISAPTNGLFVDGNVGIGATTSSNKLDVWGNSRITGTLRVDSTGTFGNGLIGYSGVTAPASGLAVSGNVGIGTTSPQAALHVWGAGSYAAAFLNGNVGIGTTSPVGLLHVKATSTFSATGGTITYSGGYTIHTFTSSGTFTVTGSSNVEVLVVAGGGGGGAKRGGGGGGGGLVYTATHAVNTGNYTVTVGAGGSGGSAASAGSDGGNSAFGTITATGGGGGGYMGNGRTGGSGGGGGSSDGTNGNGGAGTTEQGNKGGDALNGYGGAGGGGAGAVGANQTGTNGGAGGIGLSYSINGTATYYAGGGGGGEQYEATGVGGAGGAGGGGGGGDGNGTAGTANTGGGGGGGGDALGYVGGAGGSGIVIIRYPTGTVASTADSLVVSSTTGNVGIGTTAPNYNLDVWGSTRVTTLSGSGNRAVYSDANGQLTNSSSDIRLKTNIEPISSSLDVLSALDKLQGVYFNWDQNNPDAIHFGTQRELGLIAQNLETVLPELVGTNANGYKSLNYAQMAGFLVEVDKAQSRQIGILDERISSGQKEISKITLDIDKIKANQIEGLEATGSSQLDSLASQIASQSAQAVSMEVLDKLTVGELYVKKATIFDSIVQVLESLTSRTLIVTDWAKFLAEVLFKGDVTFEGRTTFNKDSAGGALIKQGADSVDVVFEKEYAATPLINVSITLDEEVTDQDRALLDPEELELRIKNYELKEKAILGANISYIVVKRTTKGFTIKLNQKAPEDLKFTWIALAVKDAKTVVSELLTSKESKPTFEVVLASPSASPSPQPSPTGEPTPTSSPTPSPSPSPSPPKTITVNQTELGYLRIRVRV